LHSRRIIKPTLFRTLYICKRADRPTTFALQAAQDIILKLIRTAIRERKWEATALFPPPNVFVVQMSLLETTGDSVVSRGNIPPQIVRGNVGTLTHRFELLPHDSCMNLGFVERL